MTREEAKAILENDIVDGHVEGNARFMDAFWMAVDALSQEPTDTWSIKDVADTFKKHGLIREQEPCDDKRLFIKIYADYEPSVVAEKVYQICDEDEFPEVVSQLNAYLEPCDDAVSREAVLNIASLHTLTVNESVKAIKKLPSVTQKSGKWILLDECANSGYYCSECQKKLVKEGWSSTVKKIKFCPNCGARMVEPQESEDKE